MKKSANEIPMLSDERFEQIEQFAIHAKPLHEWLTENYHPHAKIIIDRDGARLVEDDVFIPMKVGE